MKISCARAVFLVTFFLTLPCIAEDFWRSSGGPFGGDVRDITVDTLGNFYVGTWGAGIYRSRDGGDSWQSVNEGLEFLLVPFVMANPANNHLFAILTPNDLYRSTDQGESWEYILDFPYTIHNDFAFNSRGVLFGASRSHKVWRMDKDATKIVPANKGMESFAVVELQLHAQDVVFALAGAGSQDRDTRLYHTQNNGENWQHVGVALPDSGLRNLLVTAQGSLLLSHHSMKLIRSTDSGDTWTEHGAEFAGDDIQMLSAVHNGRIVAVTHNGAVHVSTDDGLSWKHVGRQAELGEALHIVPETGGRLLAVVKGFGIIRSNAVLNEWQWAADGIQNAKITRLEVSSSGVVYAAGTGISRSTDNGTSWLLSNEGLSSFAIEDIAVDRDGVVFAVGQDSIVFRSTNDGLHWEAVRVLTDEAFIRTLAVGPDNALYAGTEEGIIYRSPNKGESWTANSAADLLQQRVYCLAFGPDGAAYAGTHDFRTNRGDVYRSTDNGRRWTPFGVFFPGSGTARIRSLAVGANNFVYAGTQQHGLARNTNQGNYWWARRSRGLESNDIRAIVVNSLQHVYVGTREAGVFRSTDNGLQWQSISTGLPEHVEIHALSVHPDGSLFCGTERHGVFQSVKTSTSASSPGNEAVGSALVSRNAPNPFNASTRIEFTLEKPEEVQLRVYNSLGQLVGAPIRRRYSAGTFGIDLRTSAWQPGVYHYELRIGGVAINRSMLKVN